MFKFLKSKEKAKAVQKKVKLPFEYIIIPGENAVETVMKLKKEKENITPVILGNKDSFASLVESLEYNESSFDEIMGQSIKFNIHDFIKSRAFKSFLGEEKVINDNVIKENPIIGHMDLSTQKPYKEVYVGLFPTNKPYEIPAYLKYGGWNDCPKSFEHVGILKYWDKLYHLDIISITMDMIECRVIKLPQIKEEADRLAYEQACYCEDIILQGTESIQLLSHILFHSKNWNFWWD